MLTLNNETGFASSTRLLQVEAARRLRLIHFVLSLVSYLLLGCGIATTAAAAYLMRIGYSPVPYWDEMIQLIQSLHVSPMAWVWAQHNEHRIVIYKLLFLLSMHLFRGQNWPLYIVGFASQLLLAVGLGIVLWRIGGIRGSAWRVCFGILLYCLFCPSQWENFTWAFQVSFFLVNLFVIGAITSVVLQRDRLLHGLPPSRSLVLLGLLLATAATVTNGNGVLIWPTILVVGALIPLPRRTLATYAAAGIGVVWLYFLHYQVRPNDSSILSVISNPLPFLEYVEKYLGGALLPTEKLAWAIQVGEAALLLFGAGAVYLLWRRRRPSSLELVLIGILAYIVSTVAITSLARVSLGTDQAFASRYQTFALLFWLSMTIFLLVHLITAQRQGWLLSVALLLLAIILGSAIRFSHIIVDTKEHIIARNIAGLAIVTGVHDELVTSTIQPIPVYWNDMEYLQRMDLSLFASPLAEMLGKSFSPDQHGTSKGDCVGFIDRVDDIGGDSTAMKITGWSADRKTHYPLADLLFIADGRVVGLGMSGLERDDVVKALHSTHATFAGWSGYARLSSPSEHVEVYAVADLPVKKACYLGTITGPNSFGKMAPAGPN